MVIDQDDLAHAYRFALSLCRNSWLADDLAQEAILRAVSTKQQFTNRTELRKWLFRVTLNLWIDSTRKSSAYTNRPLALRDLVDGSQRFDHKAEVAEELTALFAEMQRLPLKQRQVLHLRVIEGMSVKDVAEIFDMTDGAVKTNLSLARKKLRESTAIAHLQHSPRRQENE
ncbi:RNA polymerase sigma factor [Aeoliella sp.]|uniref:RNA polymerase sigma factor n=1 Tax=Aeoliella sp. TaxID=2795800 RepID=UPI003CCC25B5